MQTSVIKMNPHDLYSINGFEQRCPSPISSPSANDIDANQNCLDDVILLSSDDEGTQPIHHHAEHVKVEKSNLQAHEIAAMQSICEVIGNQNNNNGEIMQNNRPIAELSIQSVREIDVQELLTPDSGRVSLPSISQDLPVHVSYASDGEDFEADLFNSNNDRPTSDRVERASTLPKPPQNISHPNPVQNNSTMQIPNSNQVPANSRPNPPQNLPNVPMSQYLAGSNIQRPVFQPTAYRATPFQAAPFQPAPYQPSPYHQTPYNSPAYQTPVYQSPAACFNNSAYQNEMTNSNRIYAPSVHPNQQIHSGRNIQTGMPLNENFARGGHTAQQGQKLNFAHYHPYGQSAHGNYMSPTIKPRVHPAMPYQSPMQHQTNLNYLPEQKKPYFSPQHVQNQHSNGAYANSASQQMFPQTQYQNTQSANENYQANVVDQPNQNPNIGSIMEGMDANSPAAQTWMNMLYNKITEKFDIVPKNASKQKIKRHRQRMGSEHVSGSESDRSTVNFLDKHYANQRYRQHPVKAKRESSSSSDDSNSGVDFSKFCTTVLKTTTSPGPSTLSSLNSAKSEHSKRKIKKFKPGTLTFVFYLFHCLDSFQIEIFQFLIQNFNFKISFNLFVLSNSYDTAKPIFFVLFLKMRDGRVMDPHQCKWQQLKTTIKVYINPAKKQNFVRFAN